MGLLPILLLFSCFSIGSSVPAPATDVDCDNEGIFEAVDEALKSYNEAKVHGNKFILYRITEAKIKQESENLIHQYVSFETRESVCPLKAETSWKRCDFKSEDGERGECSAHILVDKEQNTRKVLSQNCSIIPKVVEPTVNVVFAPCLGCYVPVDPNNEELSDLKQSAIENVNTKANHEFFFELEKVTNAERKVVGGWIYNLDFTIRQTNCTKSDYASLNPEECKAAEDGDRGNCSASVFVTPNGEVRDTKSQCHLSTGSCLHCPLVLDKDNPKIQALIRMFIEEYNLKNHTKLYNVAVVTEATSTIMEAGKKQYRLKVTLQTTNCSKSDYAVLVDECAIEQQSDPVACDVRINVEKEAAVILHDYKCATSVVTGRRVTIKGFSPLRSVIQEETRRKRSSEKSRGKGHGPNHQKEEKHGKMDKKEKKEKKDHDKKKDHEKHKDHKNKKDRSSEESEEDHRKKPVPPPSKPGLDIVTQRPIVTEKVTTKPPTQPPTPIIPEFLPSTDQVTATPNVASSTLATAIPDTTTLPTINETVLDFPVLPPLNVPKCPGKLWQPLLFIPELATQKTFVIDDLFLAADDLEPPKDQNPSSDPSLTNFADEELVFGLDF